MIDGDSAKGELQSVTLDLPAHQPVSIRLEYLPTRHNMRIGLAATTPKDLLEPNAKKLASMADVVVLPAGFDPETESEAYDRTYELPPGQDELIKTVLDANPHTIVVLTSGGSVDTSQWLDRVPALIQGWYAGSEAGHALAKVLAGAVNPSGKLPITWWNRAEDNPTFKNYYEEGKTRDVHYREGIFVGYRACGREGQPAPLFPFGYGLSYTQFAFSHLTVTPEEAGPDGPITVRFDIENIGSRTGADVAEVYVGDPSATVPRPQKELKRFARVELKPGESKAVQVTLDRRSLAYWDVKSETWKVDPGKFAVYVGDSSDHLPLQVNFTVQ